MNAVKKFKLYKNFLIEFFSARDRFNHNVNKLFACLSLLHNYFPSKPINSTCSLWYEWS